MVWAPESERDPPESHPRWTERDGSSRVGASNGAAYAADAPPKKEKTQKAKVCWAFLFTKGIRIPIVPGPRLHP